MKELGQVPAPPGTSGRDVGFSARFKGHSVWLFGDTFFAEPAADGSQWRSDTASFTDDDDAADGLAGWVHALGTDGKPLQMIEHTPAEQQFNDLYRGESCAAGANCQQRHTPWPGSFVVDPANGGALVFYELEYTSPSEFHAVGSSIAEWSDPLTPARRIEVTPGSDAPTLLFGADEPTWDLAALVVGEDVYVYACGGKLPVSGCAVARAPLAEVRSRAAWRFYSGSGWAQDWRRATNVFDGAPLMSVHFSPYLDRYVAYYMERLTSEMMIRTADRPEGPWSEARSFGTAKAAEDGTWDYGLMAHPELARENREYVSYFRPGTFLDGSIELIEVTYESR